VSAATAALIALLGVKGIGLVQILLICVPSTLLPCCCSLGRRRVTS
jgi:anaerobic C4-dicarboxylate transporter